MVGYMAIQNGILMSVIMIMGVMIRSGGRSDSRCGRHREDWKYEKIRL